ncbi:hypothetical protein JKP88DRAFT_266351 [Tribonema minus]|uniref:NELL2-like EGF domain-containing protein n=1 Tax=Tribonema minus TaxID=303371 RepID=A0A835ZFQ6_9STRA|nr:hypothetical protein JKP88DRAFT_266351 [Tribonema minus]
MDVNTNNHLERWTGTLKYVFLMRKKARQLAQLLSLLVTKVMPHYMHDREKKLAGLESAAPTAASCTLNIYTWFCTCLDSQLFHTCAHLLAAQLHDTFKTGCNLATYDPPAPADINERIEVRRLPPLAMPLDVEEPLNRFGGEAAVKALMEATQTAKSISSAIGEAGALPEGVKEVRRCAAVFCQFANNAQLVAPAQLDKVMPAMRELADLCEASMPHFAVESVPSKMTWNRQETDGTCKPLFSHRKRSAPDAADALVCNKPLVRMPECGRQPTKERSLGNFQRQIEQSSSEREAAKAKEDSRGGAIKVVAGWSGAYEIAAVANPGVRGAAMCNLRWLPRTPRVHIKWTCTRSFEHVYLGTQNHVVIENGKSHHIHSRVSRAEGAHGVKCKTLEDAVLVFGQPEAPSSNNMLLMRVMALINEHLDGVTSVDVNLRVDSLRAKVGRFTAQTNISRLGPSGETIQECYNIPYEVQDVDECRDNLPGKCGGRRSTADCCKELRCCTDDSCYGITCPAHASCQALDVRSSGEEAAVSDIAPEYTAYVCMCQQGYVMTEANVCIKKVEPVNMACEAGNNSCPVNCKCTTVGESSYKCSAKILVNGQNPLRLHQGDTYSELGVTVNDENEQDGDRTVKIQYSEPFGAFFKKAGKYQVVYSLEVPWLPTGDGANTIGEPATVTAQRDVYVADIDECTYEGPNDYFMHQCVRGHDDLLQQVCSNYIPVVWSLRGFICLLLHAQIRLKVRVLVALVLQATCVNTDGSYECHCSTGYKGDGLSTGTGCVDVMQPVMFLLKMGDNLCNAGRDSGLQPCFTAIDNTLDGPVDLTTDIQQGGLERDPARNYTWRIPHNVADAEGNVAETVYYVIQVTQVDMLSTLTGVTVDPVMYQRVLLGGTVLAAIAALALAWWLLQWVQPLIQACKYWLNPYSLVNSKEDFDMGHDLVLRVVSMGMLPQKERRRRTAARWAELLEAVANEAPEADLWPPPLQQQQQQQGGIRAAAGGANGNGNSGGGGANMNDDSSANGDEGESIGGGRTGTATRSMRTSLGRSAGRKAAWQPASED